MSNKVRQSISALLAFLLALSAPVVPSAQVYSQGAVTGPTGYPGPTDSTQPTATEMSSKRPALDVIVDEDVNLTDLSRMPACHKTARDYVSKTFGISMDLLLVGNTTRLPSGLYTVDDQETWVAFSHIGRKVCTVSIVVNDKEGHQYFVGVDSSGEIVDTAKLQIEDQVAFTKKCGKYDEALCLKLATQGNIGDLSVLIGFVDISTTKVAQILAAKYPGTVNPSANVAISVESSNYSQLLAEQEALLQEEYVALHDHWTSLLKMPGITIDQLSDRAPIAAISLTGGNPRSVLETIASFDEVNSISLASIPSEPMLGSAVATDRIAPFWYAGYTGTGIKVSVVEGGRAGFSNPYLAHLGATYCGTPSPEAFENEHTTQVAGVIGMRGNTFHIGVSPNITVTNGSFGGYKNANQIGVEMTTVDCVLGLANTPDVMNTSYGDKDVFNSRSALYDKVAYHNRRLTVSSVPNLYNTVGNPGGAYNVIGVGGYSDAGTAGWHDDLLTDSFKILDQNNVVQTLTFYSAYAGPGARNKPEVVGPAVRVCSTDGSGLGLYTNPADPVPTCNDWNNSGNAGATGSSLAAPQVTGLAALLMQMTSRTRQPELIKAIIMASALHNIEGNSRLSDRDGVGAVDGAAAYLIARNAWYIGTTLYSSSFSGQNPYVEYPISVVRGERVRVALVYNSQPNTDYSNDILKSDLTLTVVDENGSVVQSIPNSEVDNYEIADFVSRMTGVFRVRIGLRPNSWISSNSGEHIGLAWIKDATYVPNVRKGENGYTTLIYAQNIGTGARDIEFHSATPSGSNALGNAWVTCLSVPPLGTCRVDAAMLLPNDAIGSVVVSGSEDVSVTMAHMRTSPTNVRGSLLGIPTSRIRDNSYLPWVMKSLATASGLSSSAIMIRNVSGANRNFNIEFTPYPGTSLPGYTKQIFLSSDGSAFYQLKDETALPTPWYGSVRVYDGDSPSSYSAAVALDNYTWAEESAQAHNVFSSGAGTWQWGTPLFMIRVGSMSGETSTSLSVQNVSGAAINASSLTLDCISAGTGSSFTKTGTNTVIPDKGIYAFNPVTDFVMFPSSMTGWTASCRVFAVEASVPRAVVVTSQIRTTSGNTRLSGGFEGFPRFGEAYNVPYSDRLSSRVSYIPLAYKRLSDGAASSIMIQNQSNLNVAHVSVYYQGGPQGLAAACTQTGSYIINHVIGAGGSLFRNLRLVQGSSSPDAENNIPEGWCGSITVTSKDQPIQVLSQLTNLNISTGDTMMVNNTTSVP